MTAGDPSGQLTQAWMVAQELQLLYARSHDLADAKHRLWRILDHCARSDVPELLRLARTLDTWSDELLAYWTTTGRRGVSNGPTAATNALIKKVKRVGHGFRIFDNYRLRLLLAIGLGWRTYTSRLRLASRSEAAHHAWWCGAAFAATNAARDDTMPISEVVRSDYGR